MSEANATIVGRTVTIKGEIIGNEPLTVEGRVEGKIELENNIHIMESGFVKADIRSESITVAGGISGNIEASDKVEILKGGFMVGDIKAPRVVINDGANLKGQVEMEVDEDQMVARQQTETSSPLQHQSHQIPAIPQEETVQSTSSSHTAQETTARESLAEAVEAVTTETDDKSKTNGSSFFGRK